jgi:hypothetical protein
MYLDTIYYITKEGRQFRDMCKYAHEVAYDLIGKRKKALVGNYCVHDFRHVHIGLTTGRKPREQKEEVSGLPRHPSSGKG